MNAYAPVGSIRFRALVPQRALEAQLTREPNCLLYATHSVLGGPTPVHGVSGRTGDPSSIQIYIEVGLRA